MLKKATSNCYNAVHKNYLIYMKVPISVNLTKPRRGAPDYNKLTQLEPAI